LPLQFTNSPRYRSGISEPQLVICDLLPAICCLQLLLDAGHFFSPLRPFDFAQGRLLPPLRAWRDASCSPLCHPERPTPLCHPERPTPLCHPERPKGVEGSKLDSFPLLEREANALTQNDTIEAGKERMRILVVCPYFLNSPRYLGGISDPQLVICDLLPVICCLQLLLVTSYFFSSLRASLTLRLCVKPLAPAP